MRRKVSGPAELYACGPYFRRSLPSTTARWHTAVGGSDARCRGCDSCMSLAASHSSDRSAAGSPVDCWSGPHRCGPSPVRGANPTTCRLRRRPRSSPTEHRRDTAECNDPGGRRSAPRRIPATVSYGHRAGTTPDMHCRSRPSDCASRVENRSLDTVSRLRRYDRVPTNGRRTWTASLLSPLSGLN
jgi:hypothetical protein